MTYQVAIMGGGLAGLALAIDLAKRSYQVIVIEKGVFPRQKVCGEYISMESHDYLFSLCPSLSTLDLPNIKKFKLTSTSNTVFTTALDLGGFGISRYLLEQLLYEEAVKTGVIFRLKTKVTDVKHDLQHSLFTVHTTNGIVEASLVCNATGRKSNYEVKRKESQIESTNYVGIKYHIHLDRPSDTIEIHNFPGGYCGISNIENDKSCLCYIVNSKKLNDVGNSISALEKKILFQNKHLKEIFTSAQFITGQPVTISGINFRIKKAVNDETFCLGDAAGSIAPITGNGMSIALRSAFVLSNEIDDYFANRTTKADLQKNYAHFWRQQFSTRIHLSRYFQKLSEIPFLTKFTINVFNSFPMLAHNMIKQTHGKPF